MEQTAHRLKLTFDEYLRFEEKSEGRHEFDHGTVYAMAGGTINHNLLIDNIKDLLKPDVRKRGCNIFSENIKVEVVRGESMTYPDVVVTCHPFDLRGDNRIIRQPRLLVEVLSTSTAHLDRGLKWQRYRKIPSLWYYMLVEQYAPVVELFSRIEETDEWINTLYEAPGDAIVLPRLGVELSVGAIYRDIDLLPEPEGTGEPQQ